MLFFTLYVTMILHFYCDGACRRPSFIFLRRVFFYGGQRRPGTIPLIGRLVERCVKQGNLDKANSVGEASPSHLGDGMPEPDLIRMSETDREGEEWLS